MSEISDIQQKYLRLIEIYADKNLDNNGAEAQNLINELVAVGNDDYKTAVGLAKSALKPMQKFYTANIDRTIAAARKNATPTPAANVQTTVTQAQPSVTTLNTAQPAAPENKPEPQTAVKPATPKSKPEPQASAQPATPKSKPEPQTSVKPTAPKKVTTADKQKPQRPSRDLPQDVATDLNNYLYGTATDYPASVAAYISAEGSAPREKISHNLNVIDHIWNEYRKRPATPDAPHINRQKLLEVGLSIDGTQDEKIKAKVQKFLSFMSGKAQKYYLRKGKDYFLDDLYAAHRKVASDAALTEATAAAHVSGIFDNLPTDQDKLKYFKLLRKKKFLQHVPQELQNHLKEFEQTQKATPQKQGDENMTDLTDRQKEMLEAMKKRFADNNLEVPAYNVSRETFQIYYDNLEKIMDKHEASGKAGDVTKVKEGTENTEGKGNKTPKDKNKKLNIGVIGETPVPQEENQPDKPEDWVQRKIKDYQAMADAGKITFEPKPEAKDYFEATVNGATVHYDNEDNVKVSENADISVFEAILNEKDNQNRTINFAEDMPHDTAVCLKAACLLNGRAMTGAQPEFSAEDMQKLSQKLGPERFKQLQEAIHPQQEVAQPVQENNVGDVTPERNVEAEPRIISNTEELSNDAKKLREFRNKFDGMIKYGWIAVTEDEAGKSIIIPGRQFSDPESEEAKAMVRSANELFAGAAEIVGSKKNFESKLEKDAEGKLQSQLSDQQKADLNTFNEERLAQIRRNMDRKKLAEHDAKSDQVALIHAKRMGLVDIEVKDGKGTEVKKIDDEAQRNAYAAERNKNPELAARIAKVVQQQKQVEK